MITFRKIDQSNLVQALALHLKPEQAGLCEDVEQSLRDAQTQRGVWFPVAVYADERMVGFAMYGFVEVKEYAEKAWIDRFFIDAAEQGKGYGKEAFARLLEVVHEAFQEEWTYLSVVRQDIPAVKLYRAFGFAFNGHFDLGGEWIMERKWGRIE